MNIFIKAYKLILKKTIVFFKMAKLFIYSQAKTRLIQELISSVRSHGIKDGLLLFINNKSQYQFGANSCITEVADINYVTILTTKHTIFVANLIKYHLDMLGVVHVDIIFQKPRTGFKNYLHYVICPQIFMADMPNFYVAFQMEQSISSRWFTPEYLNCLKSAIAVVDYSLININWLFKHGLNLPQVYYIPIAYFTNYTKYVQFPLEFNESYDIVFYGDINQRRKKFITEISQNHRIKVVKEIYDTDLLNILSQAKLIINIHYYEEALLETVRIFECLSLNKLIISERSVDQEYYSELNDIIEFVDMGDILGMSRKIDYWLSNDNNRVNKITQNKLKLQQQPSKFAYYFHRFMLANDLISYDKFYQLAGKQIDLKGNFWCLNLPESIERHNDFVKDNKYNIQIFNGLRHNVGWIGCGLSFKCMINRALDLNLEYLIICEDDVEFPVDFSQKLSLILEYLLKNKDRWDIFCGIIADLSPEVKVLEVDKYLSYEFVYLDKMVSAVFNIYNKTSFRQILNWDDKNRNVHQNTIDRCIENNSELRFVTINPFIVGHKENHTSTLWGFVNTEYNKLIKDSLNLLTHKVNDFLKINT